jgi:hypothetical protein
MRFSNVEDFLSPRAAFRSHFPSGSPVIYGISTFLYTFFGRFKFPSMAHSHAFSPPWLIAHHTRDVVKLTLGLSFSLSRAFRQTKPQPSFSLSPLFHS